MNKPVCFNQPILETSKIVSFGMIIGNQNMEKKKKSEIMLRGYRQLYSLHKSRRHLRRYCKRCWNKIWYFKLRIR